MHIHLIFVLRWLKEQISNRISNYFKESKYTKIQQTTVFRLSSWWLSSLRFKYKPGYKPCEHTVINSSALIGWNILSSLNAVISTNERSRIYNRLNGEQPRLILFYFYLIYVSIHGCVKSAIIKRRQHQLGRMADFLPPVAFSVFDL